MSTRRAVLARGNAQPDPEPAPGERSPSLRPNGLLPEVLLGAVESRDLATLSLYEHRWVDTPVYYDTEPYRYLRRSIRDGGVEHALYILADGRIVDGRHRYRASRETEQSTVPVRVLKMTLPLTDADEFAIDTFVALDAVQRRHLDRNQTHEMLVQLLRARSEFERREAQQSRLNRGAHGARAAARSEASPPTLKDIAQTLGYSERAAERANRVVREGTPQLQEAVRTGKMSLAEAERRLTAAAQARKPTPSEIALGKALAMLEQRGGAITAGARGWPPEGQEGLIRASATVERELLDLAANVHPDLQGAADDDDAA